MNATDIRYYINEEKGVIVAVVDNCAFDAVIALSKADNNSHSPNVDLLLMPDTFRAKAKLFPGDTWDEELGKRVARMKLYKKYKKAKANAIRKYLNKLQNFIDDASVIEDTIRSRFN